MLYGYTVPCITVHTVHTVQCVPYISYILYIHHGIRTIHRPNYIFVKFGMPFCIVASKFTKVASYIWWSESWATTHVDGCALSLVLFWEQSGINQEPFLMRMWILGDHMGCILGSPRILLGAIWVKLERPSVLTPIWSIIQNIHYIFPSGLFHETTWNRSVHTPRPFSAPPSICKNKWQKQTHVFNRSPGCPLMTLISPCWEPCFKP